MRQAAAILAVLALASGCGNDDEADGNGGGAGTTATKVTVEDCLAGRGFSLNPSAGDAVSAVTPRGVAFTIAFFPTADGARAAARKAGAGATAVGTGVVRAAGKQNLAQADLDVIEECTSG